MRLSIVTHRFPLMLLSVLVTVGCGRPPVPSSLDGGPGAPDHQLKRDQLGPAREGGIVPLWDSGVPRDRGALRDGWWPTLDGWPPPPPPRDGGSPYDMWPRMDGGCEADCPRICSSIVPCGIFNGGLKKCNKACPSWSFSQRACFEQQLCYGAPSCQSLSGCLSTSWGDLILDKFVMTFQGPSFIQTEFRVCNVGSGYTGATQVHLYLHWSAPPPPGLPGDQWKDIPALAGGSCLKRKFNSSGLLPGLYHLWLQVDPLNSIVETNELNNNTGPLEVDLSVMPPPPPPPPDACPDICDYLVDTCNILPAGQQAMCMGICDSSAPDQIWCALEAMQQGQCGELLNCVF